MRIKFGLFIALFIAGCGIYEPAPDFVGEHDEEDIGISNEDIDDGKTCEPMETCGSDMCGVVDDGCGGTLECGPCNCVDGVAQSEVCGGCDLGVMRCEAGSTGSGFCDVPAIPGWSGDSCEGLVFVSPTGDAGGTGEKDSPLDSIVSGVAVAKSKGAVGVIVAGGSNDEYAGPVIVDAPISIVGGFDIDFQRKLTNSPLIYSHEPDGVVVDSVKGKILLERLEIRTADNSEPSGTTYAIRIVSSPRVKLSHVQGFAGAGGAGVSGAHGAQGARGADGQNGKDVHQGDDGHVRATDGGKNSECPEANGGNGGRGEKTSYNTTVFFYPAHEGQDSFGGAKGGTSGIPSEFGNHASGGDGEAGVSVIENGAHGQGGISAGEVQNGLWIPTGTGADGKRGKDGVGGGGGGGGSAIKEAYPAGLNGMEALDTGSSGGGGGAGGCGGAGGKGGSGGGASFGLFLVNSDIEIESSSFISSYGGAGGAGGAGGLGGLGGKGGKASQKYLWNEAIPDYSTHTYTYIGHSTKFVSLGGTGGNGGKGGTGGAGGGGAGGASVGIYCFKSKPVLSAVRVDAGGGGVGGESAGAPGADGLTADSFQCD